MIGLEKSTESCDILVKCSICRLDNHISADETECQEWDCWSCNGYVATIIGTNKLKPGDKRGKHYRVYQLPPVEHE